MRPLGPQFFPNFMMFVTVMVYVICVTRVVLTHAGEVTGRQCTLRWRMWMRQTFPAPMS